MSVLDVLDGYDWGGSADDLEGLVRKYAPQLFQLSYDDAGLPGISFDLTNPRVQDTIDRLAKRIRGIPDTTRESIKGWVKAGTEQGLSPAEIARQIRDKAADISQSRATMIARTETASAYNGGALLAYDDAGVTKVRALDSDSDPECAERDGQVYTLEEADAISPHPNCVLAWEPVIE